MDDRASSPSRYFATEQWGRAGGGTENPQPSQSETYLENSFKQRFAVKISQSRIITNRRLKCESPCRRFPWLFDLREPSFQYLEDWQNTKYICSINHAGVLSVTLLRCHEDKSHQSQILVKICQQIFVTQQKYLYEHEQGTETIWVELVVIKVHDVDYLKYLWAHKVFPSPLNICVHIKSLWANQIFLTNDDLCHT